MNNAETREHAFAQLRAHRSPDDFYSKTDGVTKAEVIAMVTLWEAFGFVNAGGDGDTLDGLAKRAMARETERVTTLTQMGDELLNLKRAILGRTAPPVFWNSLIDLHEIEQMRDARASESKLMDELASVRRELKSAIDSAHALSAEAAMLKNAEIERKYDENKRELAQALRDHGVAIDDACEIAKQRNASDEEAHKANAANEVLKQEISVMTARAARFDGAFAKIDKLEARALDLEESLRVQMVEWNALKDAHEELTTERDGLLTELANAQCLFDARAKDLDEAQAVIRHMTKTANTTTAAVRMIGGTAMVTPAGWANPSEIIPALERERDAARAASQTDLEARREATAEIERQSVIAKGWKAHYENEKFTEMAKLVGCPFPSDSNALFARVQHLVEKAGKADHDRNASEGLLALRQEYEQAMSERDAAMRAREALAFDFAQAIGWIYVTGGPVLGIITRAKELVNIAEGYELLVSQRDDLGKAVDALSEAVDTLTKERDELLAEMANAPSTERMVAAVDGVNRAPEAQPVPLRERFHDLIESDLLAQVVERAAELVAEHIIEGDPS